MGGHTSPWQGRRVLVTGGTGFLGSAVARELLDRGAAVVGLVRDRAGGIEFAAERDAGRFRAVHGRVEDAARLHAAMAVHEVSAVFHLTPNDVGTAAVLRAAALYHPRIPVVVARPAGELKLASADEPAVPLGVARFGELFGGGDRKVFRVVPRTAIGLVGREPAAPATPGPARDFVFVRDAARACLLTAEAVGADARPHDFTFRSGWELTEPAMAGVVADVFAGKTPVPPDLAPPANPLGWVPTISLADAVGETVAWYRDFLRTRFFGTRTAGRRAA